MKTPKFWRHKTHTHPLSLLLWPFGQLYYGISSIKQKCQNQFKGKIPVLCVGNATVGGAGKTPTCLYLLDHLQHRNPVILTRGYGGTIKGPHLVDLNNDTAQEVGDEPLLLAAKAPVVKAQNRQEGAKFIQKNFPECQLIVMDDGFQNQALYKDIQILVIDQASLGQQQHLFPAGPMREPFEKAYQKADLIFITAPTEGTANSRLPLNLPLDKLYCFHLKAHSEEVNLLSGKILLAFCGIGRPEKFFETVHTFSPKKIIPFPLADHQPYTTEIINKIKSLAEEHHATLVTTRKDAVKLPKDFLFQTTIIDIDLEPQNVADEKEILKKLETLIEKAAATNGDDS